LFRWLDQASISTIRHGAGSLSVWVNRKTANLDPIFETSTGICLLIRAKTKT